MTVFELNQGEFLKISFPDAAETGGVGEYLAFGLLNVKQKIGYLFHAAGQESDSLTQIEILIQDILEESKNRRDVIVGLAGNMALDEKTAKFMGTTFEESSESTRKYRDNVLAILKRSGIPQKNINDRMIKNYHPKGLPEILGYVMVVDTTKKSILIEEEKWNDE